MGKEEIEVYKLVKRYLKKRPFFAIPDIIGYLNYYLRKNKSINRNKIEIILKALIDKNLIIPGSKLVKENVLENQKRRKIYEYICKNPGCNLNDIMNNFQMGSNQVLWHLKFLDKFHFIRSAKFDNQKTFFKFKLNKSYDKLIYHLRNESILKILRLLKSSNKGISPTRISKLLKMHYYTLKKYLRILSRLKLIILDYDENSYLLNQKTYNHIFKLLNKVID
ncbi:MAG: hypothetical protein ACFFDF_25315 [Candidatus Odinarchaeota archaeon]